MMENTQIGLFLSGLGLTFIFLGVLFLFDKGLLAIGNLMFLAGLFFLIGFSKTFSFFFQLQKLKGTIAFATGIIILLAGHPIIGFVIELVGSYLLFKGFLPTIGQYLTSFLPSILTSFLSFGAARSRSIV